MKINPWVEADKSLAGPRLGESKARLGLKILLALVLMLLTTVLGTSILPALGAEPPPSDDPQESEAVSGPVNYDRAVRLALRRSPFFLKSSLEIEIKRLDETDSKYDMIPPVTFRTRYYVSRPTERGVSNRPYSLSFTSNNYNPFESYFTLQARKLFTQIAALAHMQVIREGIQKLGRMFLEMDALRQAAARQEDIVDLARQALDYCQNRIRLGTGTSLELRVAEKELEGAKAEKERIASSQKRLQERMKAFIGLKPGQPLDLDFKDARRQVMGDFDPGATTLEQARNRSYEIKITELKKELQGYNILMAKAKLIPSLFAGTTTPDPLSAVQSRDMFFYVGLEVPVWDGFKRLRNISRQKTILRQFGVETDEKAIDLAGKWYDAQENLRSADVSRKAAQAQEELAHLKERQGDIRYHSGGEPLAVYLEGRRNLVEAQRNAFLKTMDYDLAALGLRQLSGDLDASYVDASSWQQ